MVHRDAEDRRELIDATTQRLHAAAMASQMFVSGDGRVSEKDAAVLIGYKPRYLKNKRLLGKAPTSYARGAGGGQVSYRLEDLAAWIEHGRESWA